MNVRGTHSFAAPRAEVFDAIRDPRVLMAVIPGCESVEEVSPGEYRGTVALRLPGAAGRYATTVRLVDVHAPERAALDGRVEGAMGSITGRADFELRETPAGTELDYRGRGTIQGSLARLDSRFAERIAESLISQGLAALERTLASRPAALVDRA